MEERFLLVHFLWVRIISQDFLKENLSVATVLFQPIELYRFLCREGGRNRDKQQDALGKRGLYGLMRNLLLLKRKKGDKALSAGGTVELCL